MNKVGIGFSKPKKWKPLSWIIQLVEGTNYSHVFVTWYCKNIQRRKVFEAVGSGIRILSNVTFKKKSEVVKLYYFEVDDKTLNEIEQKAHDLSGRSYGFKAIIGLGIMRLFNWFNRLFGISGKQHNPFKDGERSQVCVETGGIVLSKIVDLPNKFEDYGLLEFEHLIAKHGISVSRDKIEHINGKK